MSRGNFFKRFLTSKSEETDNNKTSPSTSGQAKEPLPVDFQMDIVLGRLSEAELLNLDARFKLNSNEYNLVGVALKNLDSYKHAESMLKKAIELEPSNEEPYGNLLSLYLETENLQDFESIYHIGMQNAVNKNIIMFQDGRRALMSGNYELALRAAKSMIINEPVEEAFDLGVRALLSQVKESDDKERTVMEAHRFYQKGIEIFPDSDRLQQLAYYFSDD